MTHEILEGIRVIDWTMYQLGPVNTMMLAAMGAEVIKIESPRGDLGRYIGAFMGLIEGGEGKGRGGAGLNAYFETNNRCKKSIVLDLNLPKAKEVLYQLVVKSDVFMQNMRGGVAEKQGFGYETLKKINPKLIYCSGSSFGSKGPDGQKPGFDMSGAARAGAMFATPTEDGNPIWALPGAYDQLGGIMGSYAIVAALFARNRFNIGQNIETSHTTATMFLLGGGVQANYYTKKFTPTSLPRSKSAMPLFSYYKCKDGEWIGLACAEADRHWPAVCEGLGIPSSIYKDDPNFATNAARLKDSPKTVVLLDDYFARKTREEHIKSFEGKDVFWEKVQKFSDLGTDPQVIANQYMSDYTHPLTGKTYRYQHVPMQFSETPAMRMGRAPLLGEHTEEILTNILGYKKEDLPKLLAEIGRPVDKA